MSVYRLILQDGNSQGWHSGAAYPGCSRENPDACDPRWYDSEDAAFADALSRDEEPIRVGSADEAWGIIEGRIEPSRGLLGNPWALGAVALIAWRLIRR